MMPHDHSPREFCRVSPDHAEPAGKRLNALTVEMAAALHVALDEAEADKSGRALLVTGAGRGFCAGQDLTEIVGRRAERPNAAARSLPPAGPEIARIANPDRLRGQRRRGGSGGPISRSPATSCWRRARRALCRPFARIGLIPDCGGTWFLPRLIGNARARALAMLGRAVAGRDRRRMGG